MSPKVVPKFEPTVTLGNLLQIGAVVVLMVAAWYGLAAKVDSLERSQQSMSKALAETEARAVRIEMYLSSRDSRYWEETNKIRVPYDPGTGASVNGSGSSDASRRHVSPAKDPKTHQK